MNTPLGWAAACMLALAVAAAPASADDDRRGRHGHAYRDVARHGGDGHRGWHDQRRYARDQDRRHERRRHDLGYRHAPPHVRVYRPPVRVVHRPAYPVHAPGPYHAAPPRWARGGYVHHYDRPVYVVHDYRGRGLRHPPYGHHWVRDDYGDFLMVAIATGLIADLILHR